MRLLLFIIQAEVQSMLWSGYWSFRPVATNFEWSYWVEQTYKLGPR
jgi:hypothetical protein